MSKMRYNAEPVSDTGVRFRLSEGKIRKVYDCVLTAFTEYYRGQSLDITKPSAPDFEKLPPGQSKLIPLAVYMNKAGKMTSHGKISMIYFRAKKVPVEGVDYPASPSFAYKKPYESITAFFNTFPPKVSRDLVPWANNAARDIFLNQLESLVDAECQNVVVSLEVI